MHATEQREYLQTVDAVSLRQRLPVQASEHGRGELPAERDAQVRRQVLPGQQLRSGRRVRPRRGGTGTETATVQTAARAQAAHSTATTPAHATARPFHPASSARVATAAVARTTTASATVRPTTVAQPSVPFVRGDQHTVAAEATGRVATAAAQLPTAAATTTAKRLRLQKEVIDARDVTRVTETLLDDDDDDDIISPTRSVRVHSCISFT